MNQEARVLSESISTQHHGHISIQSASSIWSPVLQLAGESLSPQRSLHSVCHAMGWMTVREKAQIMGIRY